MEEVPSPENTNNTGSPFTLVLILIVAIVLVMIGVNAIDQLKKRNLQPPTPPPTIIQPTITPDPLDGWKLYKNTVHNFEFKYPMEFKIIENKNSLVSFKDNTNKLPRLSTLPDISVNYLSISPNSDYKRVLINDVVFDGSGLHPESFNEFDQVTLGNNNFYTIRVGLFEGILSRNYYFVDGSNIIAFNLISSPVDWTNPDYKPDNDLMDIKLRGILLTFNYLNKTKNTIEVKLYFHDEKLDPNTEVCDANNFVVQNIPVTITPIKDAINALIESSVFPKNEKFKLNSINLKSDGTLILEFPEIAGFTSGGSCRIGILTNQIIKTAKQFPEVKQVTFLPPEIFQP